MLPLADMSTSLLAQLAEASLRSLCLGLVALVALWAARVRSVAVQHAVWMVVLCGMILMPVAGHLLPALPVTIQAFQPETAAGEAVPPALFEATPPVVAGSPRIPRDPCATGCGMGEARDSSARGLESLERLEVARGSPT